MAEVSLPHPPFAGMDVARERDTPTSSRVASATSDPGSQNPTEPFTFPLQASLPFAGNTHQRSSSSAAVVGSRRTADRARPSHLSINALPAFEFGGTSSSGSTATLAPSPTRSPVRRTPPPVHAVGHRRGGSEFIGGDASHGGPVLLSTSPTVGEETGSAPHKPPTGPLAGRRGHAHKRSGAVSQSDIKKIMQSSFENKGSSAPTTPSDPTFQRPRPPEFDRSISQPAPTSAIEELPRQQAPHESVGGDQARSRVGFSDVLEYIPRPLSTISSDTSSSMSTVRANHSVTDSLTSIVGGAASSPPSARAVSSTRGSFEHGRIKSRAGIGGSVSYSSTGDQPTGSTTPENMSGPSSAPADIPSLEGEETFKGPSWEGTLGEGNALPKPSPAQSSGTSHAEDFLDASTSQINPGSIPPSHPVRPKTSPEPRVTKRQQKVRSWAGSFLHRKSRQHLLGTEAVTNTWPRTPQDTAQEDHFSLDNVTFDEDTTCIIETPPPTSPRPSSAQTSLSAWKPRESSPLSERDNTESMLDLDAALGSLDSADYDPNFDEVTGGVSGSKRRMHSSGETGGFTGPGMHYHRRAESAPEMEPFDRSRFGLPRLGSNGTMGPAIEEEEEDGENVAKEEEVQSPGLGVNIVETGPSGEESIQRRRRGKPPTTGDQSRSSRACGQDIAKELDGVEIVSAEEEPRFSVITKSSDESTITPTLSHDPLGPRPASAPIDFALQTPSLAYSPETPSTVSSANFTKTSFDAADGPRIHTATSSITDRVTLGSSRVGEQGTGSVDDVPSLTSSASTMISGQPTRFSSSANTTSSAERSSSLSAAVPARTRTDNSSKRSSLASLSRLVGGSYNKSKLNLEMSAPPDSPEKSEKKKGRRISRMMRFFKSKETLRST